MAVKIVMPRLGLTMTKGKIIKWLKAEGETVEQGEPLVEVMTEKVTVVVEAKQSGTVLKILSEPDIECQVGQLIAVIGEAGEDITQLVGKIGSNSSIDKVKEVFPEQIIAKGTGGTDAAKESPVSPSARRLALELGIPPEEIKRVEGTGQGGRITSKDVEKYIASKRSKQASAETSVPELRATPLARKVAAYHNVLLEELEGSGPHGKIIKQDISAITGTKKKLLSGMRAAIATRMTESWQQAPQVTFSRQVNVRSLVVLKAELAAAGLKVTFTDLIIKLLARTLRNHRRLRACVAPGGEIEVRQENNIGLAVAVPDGLLVPVIRNVDKLSLADIASKTKDLAARAREGRLNPDDMTGGVFTISNLGMFGVDQFTAILNPPESGILALGSVKDTALVINGKVSVQPVIWLTLTVDHRAVNGDEAAKFLGDFCNRLEKPLAVLLGGD